VCDINDDVTCVCTGGGSEGRDGSDIGALINAYYSVAADRHKK
jgi:hypothetical protein